MGRALVFFGALFGGGYYLYRRNREAVIRGDVEAALRERLRVEREAAQRQEERAFFRATTLKAALEAPCMDEEELAGLDDDSDGDRDLGDLGDFGALGLSPFWLALLIPGIPPL